MSRIDVEQPALAPVVEALSRANDALVRPAHAEACGRALPSRDVLGQVMESLRSVLFPGYFGKQDLNAETLRYHVGSTLDFVVRALREQVERGLAFDCARDPVRCRDCAERAAHITATFVGRLPEIRHLLALDVEAAFVGDPAATSPDEAIFCYPGVHALTNYRIAHALYALGVPLIPRMVTEAAHARTGIDIHPGADIGERFFMDHGTGIVIGETTIIGQRVRVYQGVTLGAKSFPLDAEGNPIKGVPRHPVVEDDVIIYSGATILGRVTVGRGSVIGGNVWLTRSVPAGTRVTQASVHQELHDEGSGI